VPRGKLKAAPGVAQEKMWVGLRNETPQVYLEEAMLGFVPQPNLPGCAMAPRVALVSGSQLVGALVASHRASTY
jgi:hypothetical protein